MRLIPIGILAILLVGCERQVTVQPAQVGSGPSPTPTPVETFTPGPHNIQVNWNANRETAVNSNGGGYRVYFSSHAGFNTSGAPFIEAPWVSGPSAPTTATISGIAAGTWYIKVVAFSALVPPGASTGAASAPSAETAVTVP